MGKGYNTTEGHKIRVRLASAYWTEAPLVLPPIDDAHEAQYNFARGLPLGALDTHYLRVVGWEFGVELKVDAPTVFHNLVIELTRWKGKAFVQPVADGWRWHLQFHELVQSPAPNTITRIATLRGFALPIAPNAEPPIAHTFQRGTLTRAVLGQHDPPAVTLRVDRVHDRCCILRMSCLTEAGRLAMRAVMDWAEKHYHDVPQLTETPTPTGAMSAAERVLREQLRLKAKAKDVPAMRRLWLLKHPGQVNALSHIDLANTASDDLDGYHVRWYQIRDDLEWLAERLKP